MTRAFGTRPPAPVILHSAPLVLPVTAPPLRDGAVVVRGERVLQVGPRTDLRTAFPIDEEIRWPGMITPGLVDACRTGPLGPGVTWAADVGEHDRPGGVTYLEVGCASEQAWEERDRDALITAIREHAGPVGVAAHATDPQVMEDLAVLARTFGLRLTADLGRHSPAALDEAGVLGPHCHVAGAGPLGPGERKLLRLRGTSVALSGGDVSALVEEGNPIALCGPPLAAARAVRQATRLPRLERVLVEAATIGGARALGRAEGPGRIGTLAPACAADLAVFDTRGGRNPYAALLDQPPLLGTVIGGRTHPARATQPEHHEETG
ncbi:amidohydrolase family protein [Nonomuraea africana]|uniref:Cytosine/adenosine deaminase-related metal-dependent hydrolase n=1 Tax=Nonomuraea africana TaxID=46171 RepID=A0ABR9K8T2_9ACTN|nr:amidohydrolase family protein [Nonomuraea africana]MBE1558163.1 cytosine/adenosine deaminase-related metal-dependent hydrolase [Nonomuraea africana]